MLSEKSNVCSSVSLFLGAYVLSNLHLIFLALLCLMSVGFLLVYFVLCVDSGIYGVNEIHVSFVLIHLSSVTKINSFVTLHVHKYLSTHRIYIVRFGLAYSNVNLYEKCHVLELSLDSVQ